jgi:hypothetical protein
MDSRYRRWSTLVVHPACVTVSYPYVEPPPACRDGTDAESTIGRCAWSWLGGCRRKRLLGERRQRCARWHVAFVPGRGRSTSTRLRPDCGRSRSAAIRQRPGSPIHCATKYRLSPLPESAECAAKRFPVFSRSRASGHLFRLMEYADQARRHLGRCAPGARTTCVIGARRRCSSAGRRRLVSGALREKRAGPVRRLRWSVWLRRAHARRG